MGVTIRGTNNIPRVVKAMQKLGRKSIQVGVFGEDNYTYESGIDLVRLAAVHEYGTTIIPKKAQWLTIPLIRAAKGERAGSFDDLFFYQKNGSPYAFLARKTGKDSIENVYLLVKSITIPERSFLRTGFDQNVNKIMNKLEDLLDDVLALRISPDIFAEALGMEFAGLIQRHANSLSSPPNSAITMATKGSSNPLNDTGRLIGAIRHKVE